MRHRRVRTAAAVITIAVGAAFALSACTTQFGASLLRPQDPVVMQGSALPALLGADPVHVVAFSYDGSAFHQVPVQVDQRDFVNP
jgi:hypothetical protein